jgi:hypothetical protein
MLREYREAFGSAADFEEWAGELLRRGLIESEPPKVGDVKLTDALRISASGSYYWRYLIRSFVYLDLVYLDTPIESRDLALRLGGKAEHTDMVTRFSRVTAFSQYMAEKERQEVLEVKHGVRPYGIALMEDIHKQVQDEIRAIRSKSKKR